MKLKHYLGLCLLLSSSFAVPLACAAENSGLEKGLLGLGATLGLGLAAFGGAMGQARASAAALEGMARNPAAAGKLFVPLVLSLALIESLVLYAFVIAFQKI